MSRVPRIVEVLEDELLHPSSSGVTLDNVHRALGSHCRHTVRLTLDREWNRLLRRVEDMRTAVDGLLEAMEAASEYGYAWRQTGWYEDDAPYVGDDTTSEHIRPHLQKFAELFASSCVFMTRQGQRSQLVEHEALDCGPARRCERPQNERRSSSAAVAT